MAVKLDIITNVKGQNGVNQLQTGLNKLGRNAQIASTRLKQLQTAAAKSRATFAALGTTLKVGVAASLAAVSFGISKFIRDTFSAGQLAESLQVRFKLLFNSATEGAKAFKVLNEFASKVPFSLEAIAAGSGNLAVIAKDADELSKILEITGNVAAATGLDFRQTAEQIQRAFAGGIAAADVFRERGVRAMLGFEAGAKVSIEQTRKRFFEVFGSGGQFSSATKDFEQTLEAQVSFVQDAYFRFRQAAAQPLFEGVKEQLVALVGNFKRNDTQLKELAKTVGTNLAKAFKNIEETIRFVSRNIDLLVTAFKIFIGLKVAGIVAGIAAQFVLLTAKIRAATVSVHALNLALRANMVGILITGVQLAVVAFIAFQDQIMAVVKKIKNHFIKKMKEAQLSVLNFISKLKIFPKQSKEAAEAAKEIAAELEKMRIEADTVIASYTKLNRKQKELFSGVSHSPKFQRSLDSRPNFGAASDPQFLKRNQDIAFLNERMFTMNRDFIRDSGKANAEAAKKIAEVNQQIFTMNRNLIRNQAKDSAEAAAIRNKELERTANAREQYAQESKVLFAKQLDEVNAVQKGFSRGIKNSMKEALDATTNYERFGESVFDNLTDAIAQFVQTGKLNFKSLAQGFINEIIRMETKAAAAKFLQSITGGSGSIFGAIGKIFKFNKGGIVPGGAPYTDRVPALLTPGETVIPRGESAMGSTINNNTINISGNVDQRAIDQIRAVITSSPSHVGGANKTYTRNTAGLSMRRK